MTHPFTLPHVERAVKLPPISVDIGHIDSTTHRDVWPGVIGLRGALATGLPFLLADIKGGQLVFILLQGFLDADSWLRIGCR